jgi:hypothetical protein
MNALYGGLASIALIGTLSITACSSTEWVHPTKKPDLLVNDYNKCESQVFNSQMTRNTVSMTPYVQKSMVDKCLRQNGWVQREKED